MAKDYRSIVIMQRHDRETLQDLLMKYNISGLLIELSDVLDRDGEQDASQMIQETSEDVSDSDQYRIPRID